MAHDEVVEAEIRLFDYWSDQFNLGISVDPVALATELPEDRRADFIKRIKTTRAFRTLAGTAMTRVQEVVDAATTAPTAVVEDKK